MVFQPDTRQELVIGRVRCHIAEHPFAPGMPYGQEGRTAVVYQLVDEDGNRAFKVFKPRYRVPALVSLSRRLAPFADLPGLRVCHRSVLTPQQEGEALSEHPDLIYAVVMPWIEGPSWMEVLLNNEEITQEQSLSIARALAGVLAGMEQEGLAHCDLSGPNLLLPILAEKSTQYAIELVDVEQMYGPDLRKPDFLPSGSSGYAHNTAYEGMWSPDADRFAGALLLAEILGWCDERTHRMSWGESYFDPKEMQTENDRYHVLRDVLRERWGESIAGLFEQTWLSGTSVECPTFGEWMMGLPLTPPVYKETNADTRPDAAPIAIATEAASPAQAPTTQVKATDSVATASATPTTTAAPIVQAEHLFDEGLAAYRREDWASASELLAAVVYQDSGFTKDGVNAAQLLVEINGHLAPQLSALSPQHSEQAQVIPEQAALEQIAPTPSVYENSPADTYTHTYYVPETAAVYAPRPRRANIIISALLVLALLVAGGIVWYLAQSASQTQEVAAASTATAVAAGNTSATAVAEGATITALAVEAASTASAADATTVAGQTAAAISDNATQVALFAEQTNVAQASDVTSTALANVAVTVQAQVVTTKEALVVQTSVAIRATASAMPLSANAIAVGNRDRLTTLLTLQGHTDYVYAVAFSLDGQFLASASKDHTAKVWRVSDGTLVQTIQGENTVYDVAFSPDGKTLALATEIGSEIWNIADGLLLRTFSERASYSLAFSADGLTVASGLTDGTVVFWRVIDGATILTLTGHTDYITKVAFSHDQAIIAAGANDNTIRLWRATDGAPLNTLIGPNRISGLAFSPDGQTIVSSSGDDTLKLWRVSDGALLNSIESVPALGVTFSPDGQLFVAAGSWVKNIRLWRASDGAQVGTLEGHTAAVNSVTFSPDGSILASASDDDTIRLWGIK